MDRNIAVAENAQIQESVQPLPPIAEKTEIQFQNHRQSARARSLPAEQFDMALVGCDGGPLVDQRDGEVLGQVGGIAGHEGRAGGIPEEQQVK